MNKLKLKIILGFKLSNCCPMFELKTDENSRILFTNIFLFK